MTIVEETGKLPIGDGEIREWSETCANSRFESVGEPKSFIDSFLDGRTQEKDPFEETQEKRKSVCAKENGQGRQRTLPPQQGAPDTGERYTASTAKEV